MKNILNFRVLTLSISAILAMNGITIYSMDNDTSNHTALNESLLSHNHEASADSELITQISQTREHIVRLQATLDAYYPATALSPSVEPAPASPRRQQMLDQNKKDDCDDCYECCGRCGKPCCNACCDIFCCCCLCKCLD